MPSRTLCTLAFLLSSAIGGTAAENVRLNQIQVIGTHNSYHVAPDPTVMKALEAFRPSLAQSLDYTHQPLPIQFAKFGIRQIELDIFADPAGGLFANPQPQRLLKILAEKPMAETPPDGVLNQPGFKVFHVPDIDARSTVPTFVKALEQVRDWSKANPRHVPILILIEVKGRGFTGRPLVPFDKQQMSEIDKEILSVFERKHILAPDDVRGESKTLSEAVTTRGWPFVDAVRGKVMFALDNEDKTKDLYLELSPELRDALLFVSVAETHPASAWMKINDPMRQFKRIQDVVRKGFIVRTRADSDTRQARTNDHSNREKAFASGAQFISTDYPQPDQRWSGYFARFPSEVIARVNPVNGPASLAGRDIEKDAK